MLMQAQAPASGEIREEDPYKIDPIPEVDVERAKSLGWNLNNRVFEDGLFGVAIREVPYPSSAPTVDKTKFENDRRQFVFGQHAVGMIVNLPVEPDDFRAIRRLERVLDRPHKPSKRKEVPKTLSSTIPMAELAPQQRNVLWGILQSDTETGQQLGISAVTVRQHKQRIATKTGLSLTGVVLHGLRDEMVDTSMLPTTPLSELAAAQLKYMTGKGVYQKTDTKAWKDICGILGVTDKFQAYGMCHRDKSIDIDQMIKNSTASTK